MPNDNKLVTVVGGANVDIHGCPARRLVERDSNPGSVDIAAGGVARNIAENLARLEIAVQLISAIGDDANGRLLLRACDAAGVKTECLLLDDALPTSTYLAILDEHGDMQVAVSDMAAVEPLDIAYLESCSELVRRSALLVLDTNLPAESIAWLAREYADRPVFVDTVSTAKAPRLGPHLASIHTIKTSSIEAASLSGIEAEDEGGLRANADWFHAQGVDRLFITLGESGVFYSADDCRGCCRLAPGDQQVMNTAGAGDAFLAGLVFAWLEEYPLEQSLRFALAAADVTLGYPGTNNPELSRRTIARRLERELG